MKTLMYTIYDMKAKVYNRPFHQVNDDVAIRTAMDLLEDPTTEVSKHPEDFVLFKVGTYDDNTAKIDLMEPAEIMFRFTDIEPYQNAQKPTDLEEAS